jgi:hypothetical protein
LKRWAILVMSLRDKAPVNFRKALASTWARESHAKGVRITRLRRVAPALGCGFPGFFAENGSGTGYASSPVQQHKDSKHEFFVTFRAFCFW